MAQLHSAYLPALAFAPLIMPLPFSQVLAIREFFFFFFIVPTDNLHKA